MDIKIDYRIMGIPARMPFITGMVKRLGIDMSHVILDNKGWKNGGGPWDCARRAWAEPMGDCTHRIVFEDDIDVVYDFGKYLTKTVQRFPNDIISLYFPRVTMEERTADSPYVKVRGHCAWTQATCLPRADICAFLKWAEENVSPYNLDNDTPLGGYIADMERDVVTTIPSLVQHILPNNSAMGFNNYQKVSKVWIGHDVSKENWDSEEYSETAKVHTHGYYEEPFSEAYWRNMNRNNPKGFVWMPKNLRLKR